MEQELKEMESDQQMHPILHFQRLSLICLLQEVDHSYEQSVSFSALKGTIN